MATASRSKMGGLMEQCQERRQSSGGDERSSSCNRPSSPLGWIGLSARLLVLRPDENFRSGHGNALYFERTHFVDAFTGCAASIS